MANLPDLTLSPWRGRLAPGTLAALQRMAKDLPVGGSTPDGEMEILYALLDNHQARNVLQLGTFLGWSALIIADLIGRRGGTLVTTDVEPTYLENCRQYAAAAGLKNIVTQQASSTNAVFAKSLAETLAFDAIYIDTTHHYAQTKAEIELYAGGVAGPKTIILFHDASEFAKTLDVERKGGVKAAILEWLAEHKDWDGTIYEPPAFPEAEFGLGAIWRR